MVAQLRRGHKIEFRQRWGLMDFKLWYLLLNSQKNKRETNPFTHH